MRIKTKLYSIAVIITISMVLSVGFLIGVQSYTNRMLMEQGYLVSLNDLILEQNIILSKLIYNKIPILEEKEVLLDNIEDTYLMLTKVHDSTILPHLNSSTTTAYKAIGKLEALLKTNHEKLKLSMDGYIALFDSTDKNFSIQGVDNYTHRENYTKMKAAATQVVTDGDSVVLALDAADMVLGKQGAIIDEAIRAYQKLARTIAIVIAVLSIVIACFFVIIISNGISKSMVVLIKGLRLMASGDFTNKIEIKSRDEFGQLGVEMSNLQEDLNRSLNRIKASSSDNEIANAGLIETTADASDITIDISLSIDSINEKIGELDKSISQASTGIRSIFNFTNKLNDFVNDQMAMVEESTSAITQMIASISSISELTDNNTDVIKGLEATAVEGDNKLTVTTDIIDDINSTVNEINSMSEVIENISDQTNLLAMNAAIEAAHAGDAGKGFAVVADEIRKLAEASAQNSQDISKNLTEITIKFEKASLSGQSTREAFSNINDKIKNVAEALIQVSSSTSELDTGGSQILEAMESLKEISLTVQEKSGDMKSISENVATLSNTIADISHTVTESIANISTGFDDVTESMVSLNDVSDKVESVSREINNEVVKFKTLDSSLEESKIMADDRK